VLGEPPGDDLPGRACSDHDRVVAGGGHAPAIPAPRLSRNAAG
jgi:hypothetical protein